MPMVFQTCYECGEEIFYEMDDLEAEVYFLENPDISRDVDFVTLPPMPCGDCDQGWYAMMAHAQMNEDDCF